MPRLPLRWSITQKPVSEAGRFRAPRIVAVCTSCYRCPLLQEVAHTSSGANWQPPPWGLSDACGTVTQLNFGVRDRPPYLVCKFPENENIVSCPLCPRNTVNTQYVLEE